MGCLFSLLELLIDLLLDGWVYLMELIIPARFISRTLRIVLRILVWVFSTLLLIVMVCGVFAVISDDVSTKQIGKYMIFIPLAISAVQIVLGSLVRIVSKNKK